ncbi:Cytochrome P450 [Dillenia turbinata]|uniref:Cytochrome P450 n=1 Tax=Dillenia turbinata TaxID=194707 RepID=A0AAN8ZGX9_9MAGN
MGFSIPMERIGNSKDKMRRFAFDNVCKFAFGYDPQYLLPSLPEQSFASAFEEATSTSSERFNCNFHFIWKLKKVFDIGSEKRLRIVVSEVRDFAKQVIREKKKELESKSCLDSVDLLSRFLNSGHSDEEFVSDVVISFILAGRNTTSAALSWFFWLLSKNPEVENKILKEITEEKQGKTKNSVYDEVKDMVYTHASLCESMRLYPPVPVDSKVAAIDDVLPDGTVVKKGNRVAYHPYAMGRLEKLWGTDWAEFKPERWLQRDSVSQKWSFEGRDVYTYPVFQAGPRVCLGKEMAFLQMKRLVAGVLRRWRVVPAVEGFEPFYNDKNFEKPTISTIEINLQSINEYGCTLTVRTAWKWTRRLVTIKVELTGLLEAVQEMETRMVEMSALNHLVSTHVLQQAQQIEHLYEQINSKIL